MHLISTLTHPLYGINLVKSTILIYAIINAPLTAKVDSDVKLERDSNILHCNNEERTVYSDQNECDTLQNQFHSQIRMYLKVFQLRQRVELAPFGHIFQN